jgi:CBS domain containing-hemolysin-like protein
VGDVEQLVADTGYSRFPVFVTRDGLTDLGGYVHSKDLLELDDERRDQPIPDQIVRPMVTVDQNLPLTATFAELQRAGRHMGRVTAGGRVLGVIALEDLLEELVGEIQDASHAPRRRRGYPLRR